MLQWGQATSNVVVHYDDPDPVEGMLKVVRHSQGLPPNEPFFRVGHLPSRALVLKLRLLVLRYILLWKILCQE